MNLTSSKADSTSKVNLEAEIAAKPAQKSDDPIAPPRVVLERFTARVYKCTAPIKNWIDKNPIESICLAMILIGTTAATGGVFIAGAAILIALGALTAGTGAAILAVMIWSDSSVARQKKSGNGEIERRVTVDLDDPDGYRIKTAPPNDRDCATQLETSIDLTPAKITDPQKAEDDYNNLFDEIAPREN